MGSPCRLHLSGESRKRGSPPAFDGRRWLTSFMVSRGEEASKCPPLGHIDLTAVALAVDHELTCTAAAASQDIPQHIPQAAQNDQGS